METKQEKIIDKIPEKFLGKRVDLYLPEVLKDFSRSQIKKLIEEKNILIDNKPFKPSRIITGSEKVFIRIPPPTPLDLSPEDIPLEIIYEDEDIIVVNKQAGLTVHPGAGVKTGTLVNALLYKTKDLSGIGGKIRPGIVHRLDKDTSGVIVVAKNDFSHHNLSSQFKDRIVNKEYIAIVIGEMKKSSGVFDSPISRNPNNRIKMTTKAKNGRASLTKWKVLKKFKGYTFVKAEPKSGRTHQIRVHFSENGFPILHDKVYGNSKSKHFALSSINKIIKRQALHAKKLGIMHPRTNEYLEFEAPIPQDIEATIDFLIKKS